MPIKPLTQRPVGAPATTPQQPAATAPQAPPEAAGDGFDAASPDRALAPPPLDAAALAQREKELRAAAADTALFFPLPMRSAVREALTISIARVRSAEAAGNIDSGEASASFEMLRELFEGLADLRAGRAVVQRRANDNEGVNVWRFRSPDGDEFQVTARRALDEFGEARIGLRQVFDDGVKLPGRHRVSLRVDLERFGEASVDMQFGGSSLDRRIHGLMKNPDGSVFTTASGKNLADHHFRATLPDALEEPAVFAALVDGFVDGTMQPLEQLP
jgi:hypothetical protein